MAAPDTLLHLLVLTHNKFLLSVSLILDATEFSPKREYLSGGFRRNYQPKTCFRVQSNLQITLATPTLFAKIRALNNCAKLVFLLSAQIKNPRNKKQSSLRCAKSRKQAPLPHRYLPRRITHQASTKGSTSGTTVLTVNDL